MRTSVNEVLYKKKPTVRTVVKKLQVTGQQKYQVAT